MKALLAILALSLTCAAQTPASRATFANNATVIHPDNYTVRGDHQWNSGYILFAADGMNIHPGPACDGWYGKQVGSNCVLTFRFREMDGLTCVVNTNPSPDAGQSPVEIVCTYPVAKTAAMIDKKEAR